MGYYTRHELDVIEGEDVVNNDENFENVFNEICDYNFSSLEESIKWYDHEENMRAISEKYPNSVFRLNGEGEESGDLWNEYYQNGKMQRCKAQITYEPYDKSKLED